MTLKSIREEQAVEHAKYEAAARIRELLDALKKEIGPKAYEDDGVEEEVLDLVTRED